VPGTGNVPDGHPTADRLIAVLVPVTGTVDHPVNEKTGENEEENEDRGDDPSPPEDYGPLLLTR
jgi:hypothetical protein